MEITWDERKRLANVDKHGFDFATLDESFFAGAVIVPARSGRLIAIGRHVSGTLVVVFARLGREAISVISMRQANRKERKVLDG
jgi:uncharacterized DUF497 family protein